MNENKDRMERDENKDRMERDENKDASVAWEMRALFLISLHDCFNKDYEPCFYEPKAHFFFNYYQSGHWTLPVRHLDPRRKLCSPLIRPAFPRLHPNEFETEHDF